jgi:hypothetical protein
MAEKDRPTTLPMTTNATPLATNKNMPPPPPGFAPTQRPLLTGLPASTPESGGGNAVAGSDGIANPGRRRGKEPVYELGTEEEKKAVVINMSMARGATRSRLLAVGVFLSVLAITSRSLIESMRRVWKVRGHLDFHQLADRRFVLEFSEEGDFNHVTKGGPWRYREDAVLIDALNEGQDPETVQFTTIPIWVQFRNIPFHLITKALAKKLGMEIGTFICIDNFARGDLHDKFIRARVHLPLGQAIRRWITLADEITNKEVVTEVRYERLPAFCFICGFIGHKDTSCNAARSTSRKPYKAELGVEPTHPDDPRCWYLPATMGQARQAPASPWRPQHSAATGRELASVAAVAREVEKLSVNDKRNSGELLIKFGNNNSSDSDSNPTATDDPQQPATANDGGNSATSAVPLPATASPTNQNMEATATSSQVALTQPAGGGDTGVTTVTNKSVGKPTPERPTWKRRNREEAKMKSHFGKTCTTQGPCLGATRHRMETDAPAEHPKKKILLRVPALEVCLGKEGLRELREQETINVIGIAVESEIPGRLVEGEFLEGVAESRFALPPAEDTGRQPSINCQGGGTETGGDPQQVDCKKTDPDTGGTEPGTEEGAWKKK